MAVFGFKLGGGGSPIAKLLEGKLKSDDEKQAALASLAEVAEASPGGLIPLLFVDDAAVFQRSAGLFLPRADAAAATALLNELASRPPPGRVNGLKVLLRLKPEVLAPAVKAAMEAATVEQGAQLSELLFALPEAVGAPFLEQIFRAGKGPARLAALGRLVTATAPEARRALLLEHARDPDAKVRAAVFEALAADDASEVFAAMLEQLTRNDNVEATRVAAGYLQRTFSTAPPELRADILSRLLLSGAPEAQQAMTRSLFSAAGASGNLLAEVLAFCKTLTGSRHQGIMLALRQMGEPMLQGAVRLLGQPDADLRIQALLLIEAFGDPRALTKVVQLLRDPDWWVRIMACETLGRMKDVRLVAPLAQMFHDPDCRWAAIDAVGRLGGEKAVEALGGLLEHPGDEVRSAAVSGLVQVGLPSCVALLEQVLRDDVSIDVRVRASEGLRTLRGAQGAEQVATIPSHQLIRPLDRLLATARERGASDLHITPGEPPIIRVDGQIERLSSEKLDAEQIGRLLEEILDPVRRPQLERGGAVDFCYAIAGVGRYRANVFKMKRGLGGVFRCIPNLAPSFADLLLPEHLAEINTFHQGIILVTGPAGSGKSTTLTALVNLINETRNAHVLTFEDPVEFLHPVRKALINQREIGRDSQSYAAAMRGALREDPDVIVVGELRDNETIQLALLAAETGHLVVATMQTNSATATIDKLVESFPPSEQTQVRVALSESLKLIVSQLLVPKAGGKGRVPLFEILKSTSSVRSLIRDGKTFQLPSTMTISRASGMQTRDGALEQRLSQGLITLETALQHAEKKDTFQKRGAPGGEPLPPAGAMPGVGAASKGAATRPVPTGRVAGQRPGAPEASPALRRDPAAPPAPRGTVPKK